MGRLTQEVVWDGRLSRDRPARARALAHAAGSDARAGAVSNARTIGSAGYRIWSPVVKGSRDGRTATMPPPSERLCGYQIRPPIVERSRDGRMAAVAPPSERLSD